MVSQKKTVFCFGFGLFLATIGVIFVFCFPVIFKHLLTKQIVLRNGTLGFKAWQDIPFPIYQKLYFFNITNGEAFMHKKEKPKLQEIGPYTFRSKWVKKAIKWYPNGTVSFKEIKNFVFLRNESVGSLNDPIVTLNAPMLMAANFIKDYDLPIKLAASFLFGVAGERLIVKKSIKELAFDGYRDIIILLSPLLKKDIPFKDGLFAWLYGRNDTDDGVYTVYTGEKGLDHLNVIDMWNGNSALNFWRGKTCNMINGTNAEISPPLIENPKTYSFFQSIFCRSIPLEYTNDIGHKGIESHRFMATAQTFANGTQYPPNACFDTSSKLRSGAQDISKCQYGAPVVLSLPHFYYADPWYVKMVDGVEPNASLHSFHLDVEPNTGVSIDAAVRFQISMYLQRIPGIAQLQGLPKVVFPIFWAEISFTITDEWVNILQKKVLIPKFVAYVVIGLVTALGCLIIFGAIIVMCHMHWQRHDKETLGEKEPLLPKNGTE